ncbi:DUF3298 and DUF4163 domain-containing protein [Asticcacaulis sp. AND118]|uniref:DUF3298 and DUF4163 domain-containing protein n=1 Tax=Asticcacaulis sp. AND118 TaxID=2840468 RepID=UPI001CFF619B|nr:DUF3298 and DUF4163 domain-containing protein [Asticcacaulis sp. AND118]UDF05382.1 DUF3298 and DUF4163 domain-containing protein [Asticcacaulis sp. AND118]
MRPHLLITVALCALTLISCSRKDEAHKDEGPPVAAAPLSFSRPTPDAEVALTFPETVRAFPELHNRLYAEGQGDLNAFVDQAARDRKELSAAGSEAPPYFRSITWTLPAQSEHLASLYAEQSEFTGGAHPNASYQTVLWDKAAKQAIDAHLLFAPNADLSHADAFLCRQIEAERSRRNETPTTQTATGFTCPKLIDSHLALVPSTTSGKIGAVEALFAPYEVGPYAEGAYQIRVPQAVLRGLISPAYAADFAGEPVAATAPSAP